MIGETQALVAGELPVVLVYAAGFRSASFLFSLKSTCYLSLLFSLVSAFSDYSSAYFVIASVSCGFWFVWGFVWGLVEFVSEFLVDGAGVVD